MHFIVFTGRHFDSGGKHHRVGVLGFGCRFHRKISLRDKYGRAGGPAFAVAVRVEFIIAGLAVCDFIEKCLLVCIDGYAVLFVCRIGEADILA